jgi:hypothetical protein
MADSTNPYLELLQQRDRPRGNPWDLLSNALLGLGSGISQAGASGAGWGAGIAPGLMLGNQMTAQAEHQAEQERMRRLQIGLQAQEWDEKRKQREQQAAAMARMAQNLTGGSSAPTPGITSPQPSSVQMGPGGDYDRRLAGYEGGTNKGGMIFNELGSGAFGPYQFMPGTWADVRAKNPNLNLPADMTQATREQHDAAHGAFKGANAAMLQAAGLQPTPENLYLAHRFGAAGAVNLLRADPNKLLSEVLPVEWQRQNPDMRGQTVGGFQRLATERMGGTGVPYRVAENAPPTPYALQFGSLPPSGTGLGAYQPGATDAPEVIAPVMPQPQWPTLAQPSQPAPQPLPQPPVVPPGGNGGQPQPQPPGNPNIVRTGGLPPPGSVVRVSEGPPIVPPPRPQDLPLTLRQHLAQMLQTPGVTPEEYLKEQQRVTSAYHQQLQTQATEGWREQKAAQLHAQGRSEKQIDAEIAKIEAEKLREYQKDEEERKHQRGRGETLGDEERKRAQAIADEQARKERDVAEARAADERRIAEQRAAATGSAQSDYRILTEGTKSGQTDTVDYLAAWNRIKNTPVEIGGGQKVSPDMSAFRQPTRPGQEPQPGGPHQGPQMGEGPKPLGERERKFTESESKNHVYATQLNEAIPQLEALVKDKKTGEYTTAKLPSNLGQALSRSDMYPESMVSERAKEFRRLEMAILTGTLRPASGATILPSEFVSERAKYIPQPNDTPAQIEAKLKALKEIAAAIAEGTGREKTLYPNLFPQQKSPTRITLDGKEP